jgi:hypothetical protein
MIVPTFLQTIKAAGLRAPTGVRPTAAVEASDSGAWEECGRVYEASEKVSCQEGGQGLLNVLFALLEGKGGMLRGDGVTLTAYVPTTPGEGRHSKYTQFVNPSSQTTSYRDQISPDKKALLKEMTLGSIGTKLPAEPSTQVLESR